MTLHICRPRLEKCLESMADRRGSKETNETKKWLQMVDRGGLFKVNDEAFSFFTELEMKLRHHLINIFNENAESRKESIIDSLMADEDILFSWIFVLGEVYEPDESTELLREVIELWLTIRGFSAAGAWMEYYKQNKKVTLKGKSGLRKELVKNHPQDGEL